MCCYVQAVCVVNDRGPEKSGTLSDWPGLGGQCDVLSWGPLLAVPLHMLRVEGQCHSQRKHLTVS